MRKTVLFKLLLVLSFVMLIMFGIFSTNSYATDRIFVSERRKMELNMYLGDVDRDGKVTNADSIKVKRCIQGLEYYRSSERILADVNKDGNVDQKDVDIILKMSVGSVKKSTTKISYVPGDVNGDGSLSDWDSIVILKMSVGLIKPTVDQKIIADVDGDGKITSADALIVRRRVYGIISCLPIEGDVDGDGKLTDKDADLILKNSVKLVNFTATQKRIADQDRDGKITSADALIVRRKL